MHTTENEVKKDANGLAYTTERAFGSFVYDYLRKNKVATTGDIIKHVADNYKLLEGDIVKTSEGRSSLRYRQSIDNLIKCHGSILNMYQDLQDFPGGIALRGVHISEDFLERARNEMSPASVKNLERQREEQTLQEAHEKAMKEKFENLRDAKLNARTWRSDIILKARQSGLNMEEVLEEFDDIVEDIAYCRPETVRDKEAFVAAFMAEF